MHTWHAFARYVALPLIGGGIGFVGPALAQDGGFRMFLDLSETLRASDNPDFLFQGESGVISSTGLQFGASSRTRSDFIAFGLGGSLDYGSSGQIDEGLVDPSATFDYVRQNRGAELKFDAAYSETDISTSSLVPLLTDPNQDVLVLDDGTKQALTLGVGVSVGRTSPIGAEFTLRRNDLSYSGVSDSDLVDRQVTAAAAKINFRLNPSVTLSNFATASETNVDGDGVNKKSYALGVATELRLNPVLTANVAVSFDRVEFDGQGTQADRSGTESGVGVAVDVTRALKTGSITATLETQVGENGRETIGRIGRAFELRRGSLDVAVGFETTDLGGTNPLYEFALARASAQSRITASLAQALVTQNDGDEAINSVLNVNYERELTSLSSLQTNATFARTNGLGQNVADTSRLNATISLSRALAEDWNLVGGYTYSKATSDEKPDRVSNSVFVTLEKSFAWRR